MRKKTRRRPTVGSVAVRHALTASSPPVLIPVLLICVFCVRVLPSLMCLVFILCVVVCLSLFCVVPAHCSVGREM